MSTINNYDNYTTGNTWQPIQPIGWMGTEATASDNAHIPISYHFDAAGEYLDLNQSTDPHSSGTDIIRLERSKQMKRHHDDEQWTTGELIRAAIGYLMAAEHLTLEGAEEAVEEFLQMLPPDIWPWSHEDWKPEKLVRNLAKAGALIAAEIDRLNRGNS